MNSKEIKNRALSLVRLAHESEVACIVCVRDMEKRSNVVDATGVPEDLLKLLVNASMHCAESMPDVEARKAFTHLLAMATQELYAQACRS